MYSGESSACHSPSCRALPKFSFQPCTTLLKMASLSFVLIHILIVFIGAKSSNASNNQTPLPTKACHEKPVVFNCNPTMNQADHLPLREAIKTLATKIENLITIVNQSSQHQQPKPPGIISRKYILYSFLVKRVQLAEILFIFKPNGVVIFLWPFQCLLVRNSSKNTRKWIFIIRNYQKLSVFSAKHISGHSGF